MPLARECGWRAQELLLLGQAAGLEVAATYGELDTSIALDDEEAYRLVCCLRRPDEGATAGSSG